MTAFAMFASLEAMTMTNAEILSKMDELHASLTSATTTPERKKYLEAMTLIYNEHPFLSQYWELRENARKLVDRIVRKTVEVAQHIAENIAPSLRVEWNGIQPMGDGVQQLYLVRLLDRDHQLIWSKVGTTTRKTQKRMTEHLSYYKKDGVKYIEVVRLWNCEEMEAEMYESAFRAHYMRKYKGAFRKNDRFTGVEFDLAEADKIFENLRNEA